MLIRFADGRSLKGLIVGLTGGTMRVALPGREDIFEFNLVNGQWVSADTCEVVSFEFPPGITQHADFQAAVAEAVKPIGRLAGYLEIDAWAPRKVN